MTVLLLAATVIDNIDATELGRRDSLQYACHLLEVVQITCVCLPVILYIIFVLIFYLLHIIAFVILLMPKLC